LNLVNRGTKPKEALQKAVDEILNILCFLSEGKIKEEVISPLFYSIGMFLG